MRNVMKEAWNIARAAAVRFGGSAKDFFAASLKEAWKLANNETVVGAVCEEEAARIARFVWVGKVRVEGGDFVHVFNSNRSLFGAGHKVVSFGLCGCSFTNRWWG